MRSWNPKEPIPRATASGVRETRGQGPQAVASDTDSFFRGWSPGRCNEPVLKLGSTTHQQRHPGWVINSLSRSFFNYKMGIITRPALQIAVSIKHDHISRALRSYSRCSINVSENPGNLEVY